MKIITGTGMKYKGKYNKYAFKILRNMDTNILTKKIETQPTKSEKQAEVRNAFSTACHNLKLNRLTDPPYWYNQAKKNKLPPINELFRFFLPLYRMKPELLLTFTQMSDNDFQDDVNELIRYTPDKTEIEFTEQGKAFAVFKDNFSQLTTNVNLRQQTDELTIVAAIRTPERPVNPEYDIVFKYWCWDLYTYRKDGKYILMAFIMENNWKGETLKLDAELKNSSDYIIIFRVKPDTQTLCLNGETVKTTHNDITLRKDTSGEVIIDPGWWSGGTNNARCYFFALFERYITDDEVKRLNEIIKKTYSIKEA